MNYIDYHIHSNNSFDGIDSITNICNMAINNGINEICFTEHFTMDPSDVSYDILDYKRYHDEIMQCQENFRGQLNIREGLEIGEPHLKDFRYDLNKKLENMNLDFIIGSVHNINKLKLRSYMYKKTKIVYIKIILMKYIC